MSTESKTTNVPNEEARKTHENERLFWTQVNQAAIDTGASAIKSFFLLNGGAALAILGFIGALAGQARISDVDLQNLAATLLWFTTGVALAATSSGAAYLTNLFTAAASSSRKRIWEWPYIGEPSKFCSALRIVFLTVAVMAGVGSLGLFASGMYAAQSAISKMKMVAPPSAATVTLPSGVAP